MRSYGKCMEMVVLLGNTVAITGRVAAVSWVLVWAYEKKNQYFPEKLFPVINVLWSEVTFLLKKKKSSRLLRDGEEHTVCYHLLYLKTTEPNSSLLNKVAWAPFRSRFASANINSRSKLAWAASIVRWHFWLSYLFNPLLNAPLFNVSIMVMPQRLS